MLSSSPEGKVEVHFGQQGLKALREAADAKGNGFSNWIGKAWEERVCLPRLEEFRSQPALARFALRLEGDHEISHIISLDVDQAVKKQAGSLKIPDALLVETSKSDPEHIILRSCDFKFNLGMATYFQVHPRKLIELLNNSPLARQKVQQVIDQLKDAGVLKGDFKIAENVPTEQPRTKSRLTLDQLDKIQLETGRFISPASEENNSLLSSPTAKIRRDVVCNVELVHDQIAAFLNGFPGSEMQEEASRMDFPDVLNPMDKALMTARVAAALSVNPDFNTAEKLRDFIASKD